MSWSTTGHGLAVVANYSLYYTDGKDWAMGLVSERVNNMVRVGVPDMLYQGENIITLIYWRFLLQPLHHCLEYCS